MSKKITAGKAALEVIKSWGVKQIYGLPAGSLNAVMDAMEGEEDNIRFIQVRHEEVGALAAAMQPKFGELATDEDETAANMNPDLTPEQVADAILAVNEITAEA